MKRKSGFTLVEIMIVVAIIALLALIAIPSLMQALAKTQKTLVVNNIRNIDHAISRVCLDSNFTTRSEVTKACVDPLIDSGDVGKMKWPSKAFLVTGSTVSTTPAADENEAAWTAWIGQASPTNLVVELDGEYITNIKE